MDIVELRGHLLTLEKQLLQSNTRRSKVMLDDLLGEEFIEFGSSGKKYTKEDIVERLPSEEAITFYLSEYNIEILAEDVILATFYIKKTIGVKYTNRSSIWKRRNGKWQLVFHQGTPTDETK